MSYDLEIIKEKTNKAINNVLEKDKILLKINSSERSIAFRLAIYIEKEFPGWNVDCEYNRDGVQPKKLRCGSKRKKFLPDIIVHKRITSKNLLAVEIKKSEYLLSSIEVKADKIRLKFLTSDKKYDYKFGLFVYFYVNEDFQKKPIIEYYKDGQIIVNSES